MTAVLDHSKFSSKDVGTMTMMVKFLQGAVEVLRELCLELGAAQVMGLHSFN